MGLDFDRSSARWSYGGFARFREKLASEIGIANLSEMEGFGGSKLWSAIKDPIVPFLNHSDCDGKLTPKKCAAIAPRLRQLVREWPDSDYDKKTARLLAKDMLKCAKKKQSLEFC